jgi:hypothetical protein
LIILETNGRQQRGQRPRKHANRVSPTVIAEVGAETDRAAAGWGFVGNKGT